MEVEGKFQGTDLNENTVKHVEVVDTLVQDMLKVVVDMRPEDNLADQGAAGMDSVGPVGRLP